MAVLRASGFQRSDVDHKAVFHVAFDGAVIGFVHVLYGRHFDVAGHVVLAAEIQHLLRFRQAAAGR